MTDRERRRLERAQRVQTFFNTRPEPDDPQSTPRRQAFDAPSKTTQRLTEYDLLLGPATQVGSIQHALARQQAGAGSAHGDNDAKSVIADGLRGDLADLVRTAAELEDDFPGISAKFPSPANSGYTALRTAIVTCLENLTPEFKTAFVGEEMPADFDDALRADLQEFDAAEDDEDTALDRQVRGTESLGRLLGRADSLVRKFNVAIRNKFKRDPATLRAWLVASKVERAPQRRPSTTPPAQTGTP